MTNRLSVSFPVPCKVVIVVKHNVLPSVKRLVMDLSSPTSNACLVHVDGRPLKDGGIMELLFRLPLSLLTAQIMDYGFQGCHDKSSGRHCPCAPYCG